MTFAVDAAADLGTHAVTISNGLGSVVLLLYVQRPAPIVTNVSPAAGEVGAERAHRHHGDRTSRAAIVISVPSAASHGVTVSDVATPNDTTITGLLTIAGTATPSAEARLLIVTTESGQSTIEFFVVPAGHADRDRRCSPAQESRVRRSPVTLKGLNLTGATVGERLGDIALQNAMVVDDETITLEVVIDPMAATRTSNHTLDADARRQHGGLPRHRGGAARSSTRRARRSGTAGRLVTVRFDGVNLDTVLPDTGVEIDRAGRHHRIQRPGARTSGSRRRRFDIDPMANIGRIRDVIVTNAAGSFTRLGRPSA